MCVRTSQSSRGMNSFLQSFHVDRRRVAPSLSSQSTRVAGNYIYIVASIPCDTGSYEKLFTPCLWGIYMGENLLFNARFETLDVKPTWRSSVQDQRVLVPVDNFQEHGKTFRSSKDEIICLAGITILLPDQKHHAVMVTTRDSIPPVSYVHHRMPVVIDPDNWENWLNPEIPFSSFGKLARSDLPDLVGV